MNRTIAAINSWFHKTQRLVWGGNFAGRRFYHGAGIVIYAC